MATETSNKKQKYKADLCIRIVFYIVYSGVKKIGRKSLFISGNNTRNKCTSMELKNRRRGVGRISKWMVHNIMG